MEFSLYQSLNMHCTVYTDNLGPIIKLQPYVRSIFDNDTLQVQIIFAYGGLLDLCIEIPNQSWSYFKYCLYKCSAHTGW